ncbi:MAG: hypothetical protein NUV97_03515, partial [archaeon]|nr:hypothetical protein [archaeon]
IMTIISAEYFNEQLKKDPPKAIMLLKDVWNLEEFKEIRKDIQIPDKYKEEFGILKDIKSIGF